MPGDGSEDVVCGWVGSFEAAQGVCEVVYERSSVEGTAVWRGHPAFVGSVRTRWRVRFEMGGRPVVFAGIPDVVEGVPVERVVPVAEIQSIVTGDQR